MTLAGHNATSTSGRAALGCSGKKAGWAVRTLPVGCLRQSRVLP